MTGYLINLDRDRERLAFQERQFAQLGLSFERVSACTDSSGEVNRFRWWCATLRPVVRGEVGCVLSHVKIYRLMAARGEKVAAVFEDDVILSGAAVRALAAAEAACLADPRRLVLLGDHRRTKRGEELAAADAEVAVEPTAWDFCSEGYVIGIEAAKAIAKVQSRVITTPDAWGYHNHKGWIRLARITPPVSQQAVDAFESDLGVRYSVAGKGLVERCWWKLRRVAGMLVDCILDGGRRGW